MRFEADGHVKLSGITLIESTHRKSYLENGALVPAITGPYNRLTMKDYEDRRYADVDPYTNWSIYRLKTQ